MSLVEKKKPAKKHVEEPKAHKKLEINLKHKEKKDTPAKSKKVSVKGDKKQIEADTLDDPKEPHPEVEKKKKHKAPKKKEVKKLPPRRVVEDKPFHWSGDISEKHIHELARHTVIKSHDLEQLISKQQELKDAGRSLDGAQQTLLAERRKIEGDLARVIKEKELSSQNDAEKQKLRLQLLQREEEQRRARDIEEVRQENELSAKKRNELREHEKHSSQLLEKQLELRKYENKLNSAMESINVEQKKVKKEIEYATERAKYEKEQELKWQRDQEARLAQEKKFLEEESAKRKKDHEDMLAAAKKNALQLTCKDNTIKKLDCDDDGFRVVIHTVWKYDLNAEKCVDTVHRSHERCSSRKEKDLDFVEEEDDHPRLKEKVMLHDEDGDYTESSTEDDVLLQQQISSLQQSINSIEDK